MPISVAARNGRIGQGCLTCGQWRLGAAALGAVFHPRHRSCSGIMVVTLLVGSAASILPDAVQALGGGVWWSAAEEWCDLAVYSVVTGLIIARVVTSHIDTIDGASRAGDRALTS
jgi:hypothetical protein